MRIVQVPDRGASAAPSIAVSARAHLRITLHTERTRHKRKVFSRCAVDATVQRRRSEFAAAVEYFYSSVTAGWHTGVFPESNKHLIHTGSGNACQPISANRGGLAHVRIRCSVAHANATLAHSV